MSASKACVDDVVNATNLSGVGGCILVCEHASNVIPHDLDHLGLDHAARQSHIAWDLGAYSVARAMSAKLDSPLIAPRTSRLVYDCNRAPEAQSAVPEASETYEIPGNKGLSDADRQARAEQYYTPFHDALATIIDQRIAAGHRPIIITIHSFAPIYGGIKRDLDLGIIHDGASCFADEFLKVIEADGKFVALRNAPYGPQDGVTHTLMKHAIPRGLLNLMIEIRNDLVPSLIEQQSIAERLSDYVMEALAVLTEGPNNSSTSDDPCSKTEPEPIYSTVRRRNDLMFGSFAVGTS